MVDWSNCKPNYSLPHWISNYCCNKICLCLYKGNWEVFQINKNEPAQAFWRNVIKEFTGGQFTERIEEGKRVTQVFVSQQ